MRSKLRIKYFFEYNCVLWIFNVSYLPIWRNYWNNKFYLLIKIWTNYFKYFQNRSKPPFFTLRSIFAVLSRTVDVMFSSVSYYTIKLCSSWNSYWYIVNFSCFFLVEFWPCFSIKLNTTTLEPHVCVIKRLERLRLREWLRILLRCRHRGVCEGACGWFWGWTIMLWPKTLSRSKT